MDFNTSKVKCSASSVGIFQTSTANKVKSNKPCCCDYHIFTGLSASVLLNYSYSEDILDTRAPFDHDQDYGHTTVGGATILPSPVLRMGSSFIADTNLKLDSIYGYMTINGASSATATIAICKVTPAVGVSSALTPVALGEFIVTSNDSNQEYSLIDSKSFSNINVSKGDIVFTMIKGSNDGDGIYWRTKLKFR
tara:strand:- start:1088 stop:1669 length:582 start_codon:yes stop_codon:yes gene_type:complete